MSASTRRRRRSRRHCAPPAQADATVNQVGDQDNYYNQGSEEVIHITDSCGVSVDTTTNQVAVSLQAGIQVAIALVVRLSVAGSSDQAEQVTQDLMQTAKIRQYNRQKTIIESSEDVTVTTTDTNAAVSIQILLQVLLALVIELDLL